MIYAMVDMSTGRVLDILAAAGDPNLSNTKRKDLYRMELANILSMLTGKQVEASDLDTVEEGRKRLTAFLEDFTKKIVAGKSQRRHIHRPPAPPHRRADSPKTDGPVAVARRIIGKMNGRPRWEIIDACAQAGVKRSTAATQYQLAKSATMH